MNKENNLISALNDLLETNYDAEEGYKTAAKDVDNLPLHEFFKQKAHERYDFGHVIKEEIELSGGKPEKGSSFKGDLHRAWMGVKAAIAAKKYKAVLQECEKGEEAALDKYDKVLKETTMPERTREKMLNQYKIIEEDLEEIKKMQLTMA